MTVPAAERATGAASAVTCSHCGLPVPAGLVVPGASGQFCCAGCRTAWDVIHASGLAHYYELSQRRELAVTPTARTWAEFDHPAFHRLYVRERPDGLHEISLYLEGVHCASCVWLVERVPLAMPGVAEAELNIGRSLARVVWDPRVRPLSEVARFLDTLGYRPHPFRGVRADAARRAEDRASLVRIGVAAALAANLMTVAFALYAGWFGHMEPAFARYFRWVSLVLVTPALLWPGRVFFRGAWAALRTRSLHMDVPIAVALGAGFLRGAMNTITDTGPIYFDGLAILIFLLLVGRFLQQRAQRAAIDSSELMYSLSPSSARVVEEGPGVFGAAAPGPAALPDPGASSAPPVPRAAGEVREMPVEALLPGMLVEVRANETIPADGVVEDGASEVNVALLTGESRPAVVQQGQPVFAGSVNLAARLLVRVEQAGEQSRLGRMLKDVAEGARRRAPVVRAADRAAGWFVAAVLGLAVVTWGLWIGRDAAAAFDNAIALLVVSCPCALALATPLAVTVAIGRAARAGILIRGGEALELLARPGVLVLDKTGTVTEGRTALVKWTGPDAVRPLVLALERHAIHPVAEGFRRAWDGGATDGGAPRTELDTRDVVQTLGGGLEGVVAGRRIAVGSPAFVMERASGGDALLAGRDPSRTPVLVAVDGAVAGLAEFGDPVRSDAAASVAALRADGWALELLSGDDPSVVAGVGAPLGFAPEAVRGGAAPEDKLHRIEALSARGGTVAMAGDGVNDAAAMARAGVGIGVHGGAEACLATADVYLSRPGLASLVALMHGSRRTFGVIRRNMALSVAYNLVGVVLAMTGTISPLAAAVLMPVSSATVILSSWRSRTFDADPAASASARNPAGPPAGALRVSGVTA